MEICFSFDTTGSMYRCIKQVKQNVQELIQRLQRDIPGIRIAVFAHGDYYDQRNHYITKHIDFSTNAEELCDWVKNVGKTGGGDSDECYELVLQEVQKLSWTPGSKRALVMIGDANPHGTRYRFGWQIYRISWSDEVNNLKNMGVRIYGVQCAGYDSPLDFYNRISSETGGICLELNNFSNIFDFIMAICYREHDSTLLQNYENEVRARETSVQKDLDVLFGTLKSDTGLTDRTSCSTMLSNTESCSERVSKLDQTPHNTSKRSDLAQINPEHDKVIVKRNRRIAKGNKPKQTLKRTKAKDTATSIKLTDASWTKWQLVMVDAVTTVQSQILHWIARGRGIGGKRLKIIFDGKYDQPANYEFSVQKSKGGEHQVVFCKSSRGFTVNKGSWETKLFTSSTFKKEINELLRKYGRIFARRHTIKK